MADFKVILEGLMLRSLTMFGEDIKNCPEVLWNKEYGGDVFWRQIYHSTALVLSALKADNTQPKLPLAPGAEVLQQKYAGPVIDKDTMLQHIEDVKKQVQAYFKIATDAMLDSKVDFFGRTITVAERLTIMNSHFLYHLGVCDAALRDHGVKASM